jgi:hypothetical protein
MAVVSWSDRGFAELLDASRRAADVAVRAVAANLVARIMLAAPVDTGALRASTSQTPAGMGQRTRGAATSEALGAATRAGRDLAIADAVVLESGDEPSAVVSVSANYAPYVNARTGYVEDAVENTRAIAPVIAAQVARDYLRGVL